MALTWDNTSDGGANQINFKSGYADFQRAMNQGNAQVADMFARDTELQAENYKNFVAQNTNRALTVLANGGTVSPEEMAQTDPTVVAGFMEQMSRNQVAREGHGVQKLGQESTALTAANSLAAQVTQDDTANALAQEKQDEDWIFKSLEHDLDKQLQDKNLKKIEEETKGLKHENVINEITANEAKIKAKEDKWRREFDKTLSTTSLATLKEQYVNESNGLKKEVLAKYIEGKTQEETNKLTVIANNVKAGKKVSPEDKLFLENATLNNNALGMSNLPTNYGEKSDVVDLWNQSADIARQNTTSGVEQVFADIGAVGDTLGNAWNATFSSKPKYLASKLEKISAQFDDAASRVSYGEMMEIESKDKNGKLKIKKVNAKEYYKTLSRMAREEAAKQINDFTQLIEKSESLEVQDTEKLLKTFTK